jgi:glycosyltransferase involved in cell wall biosynthesis
VIFNPIITDDLAERARDDVGHPWLEDGVPVFVAAGRLRPQKDFPLLLRAFAKVRAERPVRLIILGEGPDRPGLEQLVAELGIGADVDLPGAVTNPYAYMSRAVAFVLSSRWEGLPTVLVEALGCGAQVIATDCPSGPDEILAGGRYGTLIPVGDLGALVAAMRRVLDGETVRPPDESWRPYRLDAVVEDFLELLVSPA